MSDGTCTCAPPPGEDGAWPSVAFDVPVLGELPVGGDGVQHVRLSVIATNAAGLASTLGRELTIDARPVLADVAKLLPPIVGDLGATCGATADAAVAIADAPLEVAAPPLADNVHHWTLCSRAGAAVHCADVDRTAARHNASLGSVDVGGTIEVSAVATAYTGAVSAAANLSVVVDGTPPELTSAVELLGGDGGGWWGRSDRVSVGWLAAADGESGVASYAASLVDGATDSVLLRRAAGCAATNLTLSRQLHHGARYHVTLEAANGVGLRAAVNSSVFTVDLSTGLRPSRSAIADAAGDAVDSVSNLSAVPVVWTAQLTPADAAAVSSPHYNASGNATRAPAYPPLAPTSHFSFAVLIHEKTNLSKDEVQELSPDAADLPQGNGSAFLTNQSSLPDAGARDADRARRGEGGRAADRRAPTRAPRPSAGPARCSTRATSAGPSRRRSMCAPPAWFPATSSKLSCSRTRRRLGGAPPSAARSRCSST